jgi:hypothetical protein
LVEISIPKTVLFRRVATDTSQSQNVFLPQNGITPEDTIDWYEEKSLGLGKKFVDQFFSIQKEIELMPERYPPAIQAFRKASIPKFPYGIYYSIEEEQRLIYLIALIHEKRSRAYILRRLSNS